VFYAPAPPLIGVAPMNIHDVLLENDEFLGK
jgi:hypothetical protein